MIKLNHSRDKQTLAKQRALLAAMIIALAVFGDVRADGSGATVAESAPISDLLQRARQGVERGDWKYAVDSLQRIIDDPQGALTTLDGQVYESARMQAYRQLAALPQAGKDAYHLLYDGQAAKLYQEAVTACDFEKLQRAVDRYLLTKSGDTAAITLAGWFIDLNKPGAAITILTDLRSLLPDDPELETTISAMLAVAYAQLQRGEEARAHLETLRKDHRLGKKWQERSDQIESFLAGQVPTAEADQRLKSWPMLYGDAARTGRMPATTPVLLEGLPWRYELPLQSPPPWSAVIDKQAQDNLLLVAQMVTDREHLYLKAGSDIIAMDLLNFEVNWISEGPPSTAASTTTRRSSNRLRRFDPWGNPQSDTASAEEAGLIESVVSDDLSAQLSIAHGLIFDLVRGTVDAFSQNRRFGLNIPRTFAARRSTERPANTLIARDLSQQGKSVWSIGTGETPKSRKVEKSKSQNRSFRRFSSTPVAVGDDLLVTYWNGKDLYAGLLDPTDGNELKSIYLCTMAEPAPGSPDVHRDTSGLPAVLPPAVDDQFAYIPTNSGMLLALNLGDHSLRWASRYERKRQNVQKSRSQNRSFRSRRAGISTFERWLAGPPVVAGATILLAPPDSDYLYAFNRATGRILWKKNRGEHSYIVAADNVNLWLGGRYLTMVNLSTGKSIWHIETGSATGRAALSGERVLVPTRNGLSVVAADSGETIDSQPLPENHPPLGNLLCWDGALYSLDSQQVRKFPDLEQSYEPAKRMHAADPTDPTAAIRLAWMELLRQQPEQVLETLKAVMIDETAQGRRQATNITHLRVQALLAGAKLGTWSSADTERRLRQAWKISQSAQDKFQATLALADRLARNHKKAEAYQRIWQMVQSGEMDELVDLSPAWKRSMRDILLDKLAEINDMLSESQIGILAKTLDASTSLDVVPTRQNRRLLARTWDLLAEVAASRRPGTVPLHWNQSAALKLGRLYRARKKFEKAEYYFRKASPFRDSSFANRDSQGNESRTTDHGPRITNHEQRARSAAAIIELAQMYLSQGPAAASLAIRQIERLQADFADVVIDNNTHGLQSVGVITTQLREQLQSDRLGATGTGAAGSNPLRGPAGAQAGGSTLADPPKGGPVAPRLIASGQILHIHTSKSRKVKKSKATNVENSKNENRLFRSRRAGISAFRRFDLLFTFAPPNHLAAHRAGDGKRIWPVSLRLQGESSLEDDSTQGAPLITRPLQARSDGQTLLTNTETGLHAVGLFTGRRLWSIPIDVPEPKDQHVADSNLFDIGRGRVAVRSNAHQLDLARTVDGDEKVWSIQLPDYIIGSVRIVEDRVVVVDHHGLTAIVFDLHDGKRLFQKTFTAAHADLTTHLLVFDKLMCGTEGNAVAGYSLADGKQLWTVAFDLSPTALFKASDQCAVIGGKQGQFLAFRPADGEIMAEDHISFAPLGIYAGHHQDQTLFLIGRGEEVGGHLFQLAAIDLRTNEPLWINTRLADAICTPRALRALPDLIPLLYRRSPIRNVETQIRRNVESGDFDFLTFRRFDTLVFLDKRTGELAADPLPINFDDTQVVLTGEIEFWPDRVVLGTNEGARIAPLALGHIRASRSW